MKKTSFLSLLFIVFMSQTLYAQQIINSTPVKPVKTVTVNFKQLAFQESMLPRPQTVSFVKPPNEVEYEEPFDNSPIKDNTALFLNDPNTPSLVSPSPLLNYQGAPDEAQGGGTSGSYNIPPDTDGAVGLDKVFTTLNNNYRILDKATGVQLSIVSMPSFWASLGVDGAGAYDPRVVYDPYNNRWILAAVSNASSAAARTLLAISTTSDPQGTYSLYAFDPDTGNTLWMDFPMLGFNKNWITITGNMFTVAGSTFSEGRAFVIDYPTLLAGTATSTFFTGITSGNGGFCAHPATTYSSTEATLYLVSHLSSGGATYKLSTITGTAAAPIYTVGATNTRTGGGWATSGGNILPQQCLASCPGTIVGVDPGDQYNRCNVVFRNGFVWYAQTVRLPAAAPTHTLVQWTKLTATTGLYADGGRIEDPLADANNGRPWYGHPSITVNKNNDVLVGFARGQSDRFLGAGYALRLSTDPAGTMQDPVIYKDGEDYYEKDFGGGRQRWGDYSHTMVDPSDDVSMWTIQEYAKLRAAPSVGGSTSKWGTWWAQVMPNGCNSAVASGVWSAPATWGCSHVPTAADNVVIVSGQNVTLDINPLAASITINNGGTLTINSSKTLSCNLIVNGTLNITGGKLTLGTNNVAIGRVATLTGASSTGYFVTNNTGTVSKSITAGSSFEFPVSANTTSYTPLTIALNGGDPTELFNVRVSTGITPTAVNAVSCVNRTWNINETTIGGNHATLTFKWAATDENVSFNHFIASKAHKHNGTNWLLVSDMTIPVLTSGSYSANTITSITSFSPWVVASITPLPITVEYFNGYKQGGSHILNWKVNCTSNQAKFEIERSGNGRNFTVINNITADYLRCQQSFTLADNNPLAGINYYRIKMIDVDGKESYSTTIALLNKKVGFEIISLQPNVITDGGAILNISSAQAQKIDISVIGASGKIVQQRSENVIAGSSLFPINFLNLPAGTYIIVVYSSEGDKKSIRCIKQ